ncbi:MAG: hypothetical protein NTV43_16120 [Methylococcales bacterium]|nr:hypothetical protein [Methylococcales bacterium]
MTYLAKISPWKSAWVIIFLFFAVALIALALSANDIAAAIGGIKLDATTYARLVGLASWTQSTLGKVAVLCLFITGVMASVLRESIIPVVVGCVIGLALCFSPFIVGNIATALNYR